jgi:hypothetical protein
MKPWCFSIENPFDATIDVGKNSYDIKAIMESFAVSAVPQPLTASCFSHTDCTALQQLISLYAGSVWCVYSDSVAVLAAALLLHA